MDIFACTLGECQSWQRCGTASKMWARAVTEVLANRTVCFHCGVSRIRSSAVVCTSRVNAQAVLQIRSVSDLPHPTVRYRSAASITAIEEIEGNVADGAGGESSVLASGAGLYPTLDAKLAVDSGSTASDTKRATSATICSPEDDPLIRGTVIAVKCSRRNDGARLLKLRLPSDDTVTVVATLPIVHP